MYLSREREREREKELVVARRGLGNSENDETEGRCIPSTGDQYVASLLFRFATAFSTLFFLFFYFSLFNFFWLKSNLYIYVISSSL